MSSQVIFDHQIFSLQDYGGISRYFTDLFRGMKRSQSEISPIIDLSFSNNLYLKDTSVHTRQALRNRKITYALNEIASASRSLSFGKNRSLVHRTYFYPRLGLNSRHNVMTFYDCIPEKFPSFFNSKKVYDQKKSTIDSCDFVIAISKQTKEDLVSYYNVAEEKIRQIYLYPPQLTYSSEVNTMGDYILFVGNRSGYKNFDRFITAFAHSAFLRNNFRVICFGGPEFSKEELTLFSDLNLTDYLVRRVEGVDSKLGDYYRFAACFVFPSLAEGFGIPLLEAASSNTKICCSNLMCFEEVIGTAATYFEPDNVDSITCALESSLQDSATGLDLFDVTKFSLEKTVMNHIELYQDILS